MQLILKVYIFIEITGMAKATDGRKNNKGVIKPEGEKKTYLKIRVKKKNHDAIKAKVEPIIKKLDK